MDQPWISAIDLHHQWRNHHIILLKNTLNLEPYRDCRGDFFLIIFFYDNPIKLLNFVVLMNGLVVRCNEKALGK